MNASSLPHRHWSDWSLTEHDTLHNTTSSPITNKSDTRPETSGERRKRIKQCCTSPLCQGLLAGVLVGAIAFAVVLSLWMTSASKNATIAQPSPSTSILTPAIITSSAASTIGTTMATSIVSTNSASNTSPTSSPSSTNSVSSASSSSSASSASSPSSSSSASSPSSSSSASSPSSSSSASSPSSSSSASSPSSSSSASSPSSSSSASITIPVPCIATAAFTGASTLKTLANGGLGYTCFSFNWTASATSHTINFKFRHDSNDWYMDDVSVFDSSANQLIINGGFEGGTSGTANGHPRANNWTWSGSSCGCCTGVASSSSKSGSYSWDDGCVGTTDNLSQSFLTTIGNMYFISWWLKNTGGGTASFNAIIT